MKNTLLLLEDDKDLSETISEFFTELGYIIVKADDGLQAEELIYENNFDLLILDVNVPHKNGFKVLTACRKSGETAPAIFLTSRNHITDICEGYDSGCDDYIKKPFLLDELRLRIETLLKRAFYHVEHKSIFITKEISYDTSTQDLIINKKPQHLQKKEAKLLRLFLQHANEDLSHEQIISHLWEYDETHSEGSLRTFIKNLRKYIGKEKIVSIKRIGYKYIS